MTATDLALREAALNAVKAERSDEQWVKDEPQDMSDAERDAAYKAYEDAANPQTVLALLARLEEAERQLRWTTDKLDAYQREGRDR